MTRPGNEGSGISSKIVDWVRNGPSKDDGTLGWMFGNMLHWRMQATMALTLLPFAVGLVALSAWGGLPGVLATAVAAAWSQDTQMKVNPKYNVTKNY
jgi:hypothetical protein